MKFLIVFMLFLIPAAAVEIPLFEDHQKQARLDIVVVSGTNEKDFLVESVGGGLGVIDYNEDGWMDLYVVNGGTIESLRSGTRDYRNALYRNNADGTFTDVTQAAGVSGRHWGKGVLVADIDNDGYDDLYVANYGSDILYRNNGDGTFTDVSKQAGIVNPSWSSAAAAADYDNDGDLDIFVANYLDYDIDNLPVEGKFCFYRSIPVACGPRGLKGASDVLYRNNGDGTFTDVSTVVGVSDKAGFYGLGAVWGDYDNDGDTDLYVANDSTANYLYQNQGIGTFKEVGAIAGVAYSEDGREQAGMGVDMADYNNDGWLDLVVTNFSHDYNTIYQNTGNGFFQDVSLDIGLAEDSQLDLSWGTGFWDFNNDGLKDLFIANGHIYPQVDEYALRVFYRQPNKLYLNDGTGRLVNVSSQSGRAFEAAKSSRGAAFADFNNDGRIDIALVELDDVPSLLINRTKSENHWIMVKLEGSKSNRNAVGARVSITTGRSTQIREVKAGSSYASSNDFRLHFGMGTELIVRELKVRWPSGKVSALKDLPVNQFIHIKEQR